MTDIMEDLDKLDICLPRDVHTIWTMDEAIALARRIENLLSGLNAHCAIGGSVLHRGQSHKDCDIFIYPHKTSDIFSIVNILERIGGAGITLVEKRDHREYGDGKAVYQCADGEKRVDIFFMQ